MSKEIKKPKTHVKRGDVVMAVTGEDADGKKTGKVLHVSPQSGRAIVEGFNFVKKHMRKSQDNPEGGIIEKEAPIALSNLKLHEAAEPRDPKAKAKKTTPKKK